MTQSAPKTKTVTLTEPIEHGGGVIHEVVLGKPHVRDLRAMEAALKGVSSELEQGVVLITVLSGLTADAVDEMSAEDFASVQEAVASFFPQGSHPATGEG